MTTTTVCVYSGTIGHVFRRTWLLLEGCSCTSPVAGRIYRLYRLKRVFCERHEVGGPGNRPDMEQDLPGDAAYLSCLPPTDLVLPTC